MNILDKQINDVQLNKLEKEKKSKGNDANTEGSRPKAGFQSKLRVWAVFTSLIFSSFLTPDA